MTAREVDREGGANSKLRRLLARGKSFNCADVKMAGSALSYKAVNRKSARRRPGPAKILAADETGATVKFQSHTRKVARYCVEKKVEAEDVESVEWDSASAQSRMRDEVPWGDARMERNGAGSDFGGHRGRYGGPYGDSG